MKLRIWWIPQIPGNPFHVCVDSVAEGVHIMDILAEYDQFQLDNNIKPDFCNAGGLEMCVNGSWYDWVDDETLEDDPRLYLENQVCSYDDYRGG